MDMKKLVEALVEIQSDLKAPKGNYNSFGNYKYRSCEDILEAVKPLLKAHGVALKLADSIEEVGGRVYVKATATLTDGEGNIEVTAYAREAETKKGMDDSQITGTASSYARKYALNGLFCIDDTKDADTDEYAKRTGRDTRTSHKKAPITDEQDASGESIITGRQAAQIAELARNAGRDVEAMCQYFGVESCAEMTVAQYAEAYRMITERSANNG